jgi:hypothetical protein
VFDRVFMRKILSFLVGVAMGAAPLHAMASNAVQLTRVDYEDRVKAAWTGQILAVLMGFPFEHKPASTQWVEEFPKKYEFAIVDDDWYYEMVAIRGFERFGIGMTVEQLGRQWAENSAGSWGSSEQARLLLMRALKAPDTGHPRYNKLWFTIGPQFSSDVYGLLAPAMPNLAGRLARDLGHINGYAEGTDGAAFVAGMVSLAFCETDPRQIVRRAAQLIHPASPYRQCLDQVITMAEGGQTAARIAQAVEDRWHHEYPATNNAVANGGLVAIGTWFGEGDFLKTVNLVYQSADFTDSDCNAANAAAVVGAMQGMKSLPAQLVAQLNDHIVGSEMGGVKLTPAVDEKISDLARRTAKIGEQFLVAHGANINNQVLTIPTQEVVTQPAELFSLSDLMKYWNPDWKLERAGFGGAGGGLKGLRGITFLDGDVLATYPRDEVRGLVLRRSQTLGSNPSLHLQVAADPGRAWQLDVYVNNSKLLTRVIEGGSEPRQWRDVHVDLASFSGKTVELRLYQLVLVADRVSGNAYWKAIRVE